MTPADRRLEIISILAVSGHATSRELAQELGVSSGTILHDVIRLSYGYPIYTKQGGRRRDLHHGSLQAVCEYAHIHGAGMAQR